MNVYKSFVRLLFRNYLIGSLIAVFGVGGVVMFSTVKVTLHDALYMVGTLILSVFFMLLCESHVFFRHHLRPITRVFKESHPSLESMRAAYLQIHKLPGLSVRRTLGPHLFGLAIPGVLIALLEIKLGIFDMPYRYVALAAFGCVLVSGMHAMIEFYLTTEAIHPMLQYLRTWALDSHEAELELGGTVLISVRKKFLFSVLLIGTFPLLLFGFATQVHLTEISTMNDDFSNLSGAYWRWAGIVLVMGTLFAGVGAWLMSSAVQKPILQMQELMRSVQRGHFDVRASDTYSDEFSRLISGFNTMVQGLRLRDDMNSQLLDSYFSTLAAALDARDPYTAGHSIRVAHYSYQIGRLTGLVPEELDLLRKSALLHDIGKIGIRDDVLLKEGRLTDDEFAQIKMHPVLGEAILLRIHPVEAMAPLLPGVRSHHERYDGRGYPDGLAGTEIPLFGRIIAVADAFDAMTSNRPYRQGMPIEKALSILTEGRGTQWDPQFAELFINWVRTQEIARLIEQAEGLEKAI
ncbi:MAG: HD domain-containing phosphohydrolase [Tumebacillaceae bacterium]